MHCLDWKTVKAIVSFHVFMNLDGNWNSARKKRRKLLTEIIKRDYWKNVLKLPLLCTALPSALHSGRKFEITKTYLPVIEFQFQIQSESSQNLVRIRSETSQNPVRNQSESSQNPVKIQSESSQNPVRIQSESSQNPVKIFWVQFRPISPIIWDILAPFLINFGYF